MSGRSLSLTESSSTAPLLHFDWVGMAQLSNIQTDPLMHEWNITRKKIIIHLSLKELNNELFKRSAGISYRLVGFSHDTRACCCNNPALLCRSNVISMFHSCSFLFSYYQIYKKVTKHQCLLSDDKSSENLENLPSASIDLELKVC